MGVAQRRHRFLVVASNTCQQRAGKGPAQFVTAELIGDPSPNVAAKGTPLADKKPRPFLTALPRKRPVTSGAQRKLGTGRISLNDDRRRLAVKGKALGRKLLEQVATIATPDTILR